MAGSLNDIIGDDGKFCMDSLENLGDAREALGECFEIIRVLADGDPSGACAKIKGVVVPDVRMVASGEFGVEPEGEDERSARVLECARAELASLGIPILPVERQSLDVHPDQRKREWAERFMEPVPDEWLQRLVDSRGHVVMPPELYGPDEILASPFLMDACEIVVEMAEARLAEIRGRQEGR